MNVEKFPKSVRIVEVGPRDGLQNEKKVIHTADKAKFITLLKSAGHKSIEVASFVRPDRIPQMGDATEVFDSVKELDDSGCSLVCLVPNLKGLEIAKSLGVKEIAVFTASSDSFNQKNINATVSQSFERIEPVIKGALDSQMKVRGYVSTAFGCPYEGAIKADKVKEVSDRLNNLGCYEISLGDTIGSGTPLSVRKVLDEVLKDIPKDKIALHFHDTRALALSNVMAGLEYGISVFDASAGGLGGCPYAKGATGNLATEDLLYLLQSLGIETGIDLEKQAKASRFMLDLLERKTNSKFLQAYLNAEGNLYLPKP
ncbi:MAG: hydroxymethylglutaryl-CoA lyase [Halobacteriovoraceae bacterium]|nr:hydroxymethylglutaryl-CoA lyase [Halobacteriovoraceae bacterium]